MSTVRFDNSRLLAHRGLWKASQQQNTVKAISLACASGFGVETDLRDFCGSLRVSHDPIVTPEGVMTIQEFQQVVTSQANFPMLALNIKSDGLAKSLRNLVNYPKDRYFYFDMSWPQLHSFVEYGLPVAIRVSEWEPLDLSVFDKLTIPVRIWLDSFRSDWWLDSGLTQAMLEVGQVTIVSPEIHGRDPYPAWDWFAECIESGADMYLCTDKPHEFLKRVT